MGEILHGLKLAVNNLDLLTDGLYVFDQDCGDAIWFVVDIIRAQVEELDEWLSYMDNTPVMDDRIREYIRSERDELKDEFCRGCGYCMPCTAGIQINQCNRMSLMLRRAPSAGWLGEHWQNEMAKIKDCIQCGACLSKCPYGLDIPELLKKNYEDYREVLAGNRKV